MHLIQRETKRVIEFPSLMFVQRIPYQSVRRRRIRHWALLLMRAAAIALIVAAFARPFFPPGRGAASPRSAARARSSSCSISRRAWATATTGSARRTRRAGVVARHRRRRSRDARAVQPRTPRRTCARPPTATRLEGAINAAKVGVGRDPLRPGAQARREHPRAGRRSSGAKRS